MMKNNVILSNNYNTILIQKWTYLTSYLSIAFFFPAQKPIWNNNCFRYWCDTVIAQGTHWLSGCL